MAFSFDAHRYRYASRRTVVYGGRGMVCASQPLAAQAGLDMLKRGGNAVDAAVAAAACLTVTEPTCNGLGGDAFALVWSGGRLHGLNGSGGAPSLLTAELLRERGHEKMPRYGWGSVTVPGLPAAWAELSRRFGALEFAELLAPAAAYAEEGYPVSPTVAALWEEGERELAAHLTGPQLKAWCEAFAPRGRTPYPGELWRCPAQARTLRDLAATQGESFYRGALAEKIAAFSRRTGGYLRVTDLAAYRPEWVAPISAAYKGYEVWEIPPNGQGLVVLMALRLLNDWAFTGGEADLHRQIEALKLAFADGRRYIADPAAMRARAADLLAADYSARRRSLIGERALLPESGDPFGGGTVYLCAADGDGNMVSLIQSNYLGFGSGLVVPGTGIALNNRAANFSLDPDSVNCLQPGKKPYHTIIPGFLTKGGRPVGPFGVMGAFMQPQGQLQVLINLIDYGMNPQEALDAPRWQWIGGRRIEVEPAFPRDLAQALAARGHEIFRAPDCLNFGRGQMILRGGNGALAGASEPRADGCAAAW